MPFLPVMVNSKWPPCPSPPPDFSITLSPPVLLSRGCETVSMWALPASQSEIHHKVVKLVIFLIGSFTLWVRSKRFGENMQWSWRNTSSPQADLSEQMSCRLPWHVVNLLCGRRGVSEPSFSNEVLWELQVVSLNISYENCNYSHKVAKTSVEKL